MRRYHHNNSESLAASQGSSVRNGCQGLLNLRLAAAAAGNHSRRRSDAQTPRRLASRGRNGGGGSCLMNRKVCYFVGASAPAAAVVYANHTRCTFQLPPLVVYVRGGIKVSLFLFSLAEKYVYHLHCWNISFKKVTSRPNAFTEKVIFFLSHNGILL